MQSKAHNENFNGGNCFCSSFQLELFHCWRPILISWEFSHDFVFLNLCKNDYGKVSFLCRRNKNDSIKAPRDCFPKISRAVYQQVRDASAISCLGVSWWLRCKSVLDVHQLPQMIISCCCSYTNWPDRVPPIHVIDTLHYRANIYRLNV